jgi:uncharacterized protein YeaO (DUF488 family)
MALYTKSIHKKPEKSDGYRICIMRFIRPYYKYDEWIPDLAPSKELLEAYHSKKIDWDEFTQRYSISVLSVQTGLIKKISDLAVEKDVTILCSEKTSEKCHRRLLANECKKHSSKLEVILDGYKPSKQSKLM